MKRITLILIAVMLSGLGQQATAQGKFGIFIGAGTMFYEGDLKERPWPHPLTMRWTADVGLLWQINRRWGVHLNYTVGQIVGDDVYALSVSKRERGLRFHSLLHEISIRGTYDILRNDKWRFLPYVTAGIGALNFEPKRDGVALRPMATEGVSYLPWTVSFPAGIGMKYQLSCRWALKGEIIYHWTLTDYLDDVSAAYPDVDAQVAGYTDPGGVSPPREMRGDPRWKDGF